MAEVKGINPLSNFTFGLSSLYAVKDLSNSNFILFHVYNLPVVNYNLDKTPLIESYIVLISNFAISSESSVIFKSLYYELHIFSVSF